MNFVIVSPRVRTGLRPVHYWTLAQLLRQFGIKGKIDPLRKDLRRPVYFGKRARWNYWDLVDAVKLRWKLLARKLHPDITGRSCTMFAQMSAIHDTIMVRLERI